MKIVWSPDAVQELRARYGSDIEAFRLVYDTEGCGCAVNGVPALWAVTESAPGEIRADSEPFVLWHDPRHALYFDETLRIDFRADTNSFRLASDNQIYTSRMVLADRREQAEPAAR
ncbi:iron-sulfur cluster biosynthesis family protein [Cohnella pontilimi]|uniref:Iron-sulfur cluster biosynthesis family protein n=1 Tax=Cohnella pontilimi TaxID=2564100 RepID=A0A4V5LT39_9BACL|nr:iron-sulfur cluster biosynthesis family protein [Cohnella pontilimi]TJY44249.1 iron-sulfur cluster biosynthesis family protein [Cohnella pontilimi]